MLILLICFLLLATLRIVYLGLKTKSVGKRTLIYEQNPENPTFSLLCVGDSMTMGVGASNSQNSLIGNIGSSLLKTQVVSHAKLGITTSQLFEYVKKQELKKYDTILVMIGGMDVIKMTNTKKLEKTLDEFIAFLKNHSNKIILMFPNKTGSMPIYHFPLTQIFNSRVIKVQKIFRGVGEKHECILIDGGFDELLVDKKKYFSADRSHPNDEGYKHWYEQIKKHFVHLMV